MEARVSSGDHAMVAPGIAPALWNCAIALLEQRGGACGQVQIELCVGRRRETQQAWIERYQLIDRRSHQV